MESEDSRTPYNSIYKALKSSNAQVNCCMHGTQCQYGRGKPVEKNDDQYVNLPEPTQEQQLTKDLSSKLRELAVQEQQGKTVYTRKEPTKKGSVRVSKDKRKKKKSVPEENEAYEMLGPPATEDSTKSSFTMPSDPPPLIQLGEAHVAYIGPFTASDAELRVTRRGEFSLYHLFEAQTCLNNLNSGLPLMLVYFTTTKKHRHYPIRTCGTKTDLQFYVDCGYPNIRKHRSLDHLVKYYKNSGAMLIQPEDTYADAVSWWLE